MSSWSTGRCHGRCSRCPVTSGGPTGASGRPRPIVYCGRRAVWSGRRGLGLAGVSGRARPFFRLTL